jgi:hypothetical protein
MICSCGGAVAEQGSRIAKAFLRCHPHILERLL